MRLVWIVAAACLAAASAAAQTKIIATSGDWGVFSGKTVSGDNKGGGVCGVSRETDTQYFGLKLFAGEDTFSIQMGTKRWAAIAENQRIGVTMRIDSQPLWRATGNTFRFPDGDMGIEYDINRNQVGKFMTEFRAGTRIHITFANPGMPPWDLSLTGTAALSDAFMGCTRTLK